MKKGTTKKFFSLLLSAVMLLGLVPLVELPTAFADTWGGSYTTNSGYSISGTTISITSANGFAYIADRMVNGNYLTYTLNLETDLNMNNNAFKGMTPYDNPFKGTFNGKNHTISNFKMDMSDNRVGMFRKVDGCTVKDITFSNVSINGTKTGTGVVAGLADGAACTFTNVKVTGGTVTGNARTGGIVGELNGSGHHTFTNCSNGAKISQTGSDIGGIVGSRQVNDYVTYNNCSNTGEVYGNYAGGIMGWNKGFGNYTDCTNSGYIHTYNGGEAGGISGKVEDDKQIYTRCRNTGTITASGHAAGLLGFIEKSSSTSEFYNCENTGTITSTGNCAGGMLGRYGADLDRHVFQNCVNRGAVTASSRAGGMVGDNKGHAEYTNCVNYANISASGSDAGGICGYAEDDEQWMTDCINYGSVTSGSACAGGMIGYSGDSAAGTFTRCFNFGNVTAGSHGGGIIGGEDWGSPAGVVSYCMNWGDVNANNNGGGIVGNGNWLDVQLCFNKGNIKKRDNNTGYSVGGMVGDDSNRVENCFNTGTVRYGDYAAGMVGYKAYGTGIVNCYNAGSVTNASNNYQIYGNSSAADTNNYYLSTASGTARSGETAKTAAQLQASDMPGQLNSSAYVLDTWNVNSKYPIHKWWRDGYFYFTANFTDGGNTVSSVRKLYNNSITAPTRSKTGYDFNGWYSGSTRVAGSGGNITAGVTTPMNTTSLTRAANTATWEGSATYTASWTAHTYTIRFNGNGSTYGMMEDLPMVYDTAKNLPAVGFSRAFTVTYNYNYTGSSNTSATATATFNGWAESENGAKKYNDLQNVNNLTAENGATVNLFAKWTDASVTLPTPTRTGYTFGGWYGETDCTNKIGDGGDPYTPIADRTLFARWTPITYTVTYDGNGNTDGSTASSTHTYDAAKDLTANGYTRVYTVSYNYKYNDINDQPITGSDTAAAAFNGWATSADGEKAYDDGQGVLNLRNTAGTFPLFANWTLASVTLPDPARDGYTFGGWFTDGDCTEGQQSGGASVTPTADIAYFAKWTPNAFKVHFNGNGATSGEMADQDFTYDVPQNLTENAFKKEYTVTFNHKGGSGDADATAEAGFYGWALTPAGDRIYLDKESVSNLTAAVGGSTNLYAKWSEMGSVTLPASAKEGCTFEGWFSDADLTNKVGDAGAAYTPAENGVTLYAKHTTNTYTITFKSENGTVLDTKTVAHGETPVAPAIPAKAPTATQHFTGAWDKPIVAATETTTYTVVYTGADHTGGEATCIAQAVCGVCGASYGVFDNTNHKHTHDTDAVTANCVTEGFTAGVYCDDCRQYVEGYVSQGYDFTENGHSYGNWSSNGDGTHTKTCSRCAAETENHTVTTVCSGGTATCIELAVCADCGEPYGDYAAHQLTEVPAQAPSCLAPGHVAYWHCDVCGKDFTDETATEVISVFQNSHSYGELIPEVPAKCEEPGTVAHYHCSVCGSNFDVNKNVITDLVIPATNHAYGELIAEVPAKCEEDGTVAHYHCNACGKDFNADKNVITDLVIPATNHAYGELIAEVPAKCEEDGTVAHYHCNACGKDFDANKNVITDLVIPATDHAYGELITEVPAKCEEDGTVAHYHCSNCGKDFDADKNVITDLVIPATNHAYGELIAEVPAKCEEDGTVAHYHCRNCGKDFDANKNVITDLVIPATDHAYGELITEVPAKCEEDGTVAHYHCSNCGKDFDADKNVITDLVIPATNHAYGELIAEVPAKCEEDGTVAHYHCNACGKDFDADKNVITDLVIPATDHAYGELIAEVPAKCEEDGTVAHYHCNACGKNFDADKTVITDLVIPATDHAYGELIAEVPAKCEEDGTVAHYHCSNCGKDFDADKNVITDLVIPATNHAYGELIAEVPAKCEEDGTVAHYHCRNCGKDFDADKNVITDLVIPATDHAYGNWESISDAEHQRVCANDPIHHIETAPHTWNEGQELGGATCLQPGHKLFTCTVCGATKEEDTAYGVHHLNYTEAVPATCKEAGFAAYWYCDVCERYFLTEDAATPLTADELAAQGVIGKTNDHTSGAAVKENEVAATCTEPGSYDDVVYCTVCGNEISRNTVPVNAPGHTPGTAKEENRVEATCTAEGSYDEVVRCTVCGEAISTQHKTVGKLAHTPGEAAKENEVTATCTTDGGYDMVIYCSVCGNEISREPHVIPAGHIAGEIAKENDSAPTCTEAGSYDAVVYCTKCGEEMSRDTVTVPAKGHTWGEWEVVTPANEETDGEAKRVCSVCGAEETKPISAMGDEITKTVKFVNIGKMHYEIDLGNGETYTVYNSSTVQWISRQALRFRVVTYAGYNYDDIIIRANGKEITPDADGYYSLPKTAETVIVTAEGAVKDDSAPSGKLSFWELLIQFFKKIVFFFSTAFGKQSIC